MLSTTQYIITLGISMLVTCGVALFTNHDLATVSYINPRYAEICTIVTLILLIICLLLAMKLLPTTAVYQVSHMHDLRFGMNVFITLSNIYLWLQLDNYKITTNIGFIIFKNLISICILLFIANWAFLFFNIRILRLLNIQTENQQMQIKIEKLNVAANIDVLTGISNKTAAIKAIEKMIADGGVMFVIDIDNFKRINDTFGHRVGDTLLKNISSIIKTSFRSHNIVGRFGGDEFLVFMRYAASTKEMIERKSADLCFRCQKPLSNDDGTTLISSISIGALLLPPNSNHTFVKVFEMADEALYESKNKGKNGFTVRQLPT